MKLKDNLRMMDHEDNNLPCKHEGHQEEDEVDRAQRMYEQL